MSLGATSFTPNAKPFTPGGFKPAPREPTPPPKDMVVEQFNKWGHSEREINDFKELVSSLKDRKSSEPISLDVFKIIISLEVGKKNSDFKFF